MTTWWAGDDLAEDFEQHRERLVRVAHRMLGSSADAEDAVQEAWLRLARQDASKIDNLAAWLTRVVARICLDALRARKVRRESPFEGRPPELVATEDEGAGMPEEQVLLAESVGVGLLTVLDTLSPSERVAFVLHDLFVMPFHEVAETLAKSPDATKMLGSRARRKLSRTCPPDDVGRVRRDVVDAFWSAARGGDVDDLVRALDAPARQRVSRPGRTRTAADRASHLRGDGECRQAG